MKKRISHVIFCILFIQVINPIIGVKKSKNNKRFKHNTNTNEGVTPVTPSTHNYHLFLILLIPNP